MKDQLATIDQQRRLRQLLEANRSIVSELSLAAVLRRIVEGAQEVAGAGHAALGVIGSDQELAKFVASGTDPAAEPSGGQPPTGPGVVDVPIPSRGGVFAHLYLSDRLAGGEFTAEDRQLVRALADAASVAIENARLYEESRRRQEWLRASAEITRDLLRPEEAATDVLVRIADSVRRLADAEVVTVVFPTRVGDELVVRVARGANAERLVGSHYPVAGSLAGVAITEGRATLLNPDRDAHTYYIHLQTAVPDLGPVMACPLVGEANIRGAVVVGRRRGQPPFRPQDRDMAEGFASHATIALELADRRADQQRLTVLEDRHRIARDLHDHVIQRLFATGLSLQATASGVDEPMRSTLQQSVDDLDDTIRQIRAAIFELAERRAPGEGTARDVLLGVAAELEPALGFVPAVRFSGPVDTVLDEALLTDVAAVLREGLANAARHSRATQVTADVTVTARQVDVKVTDNGAKRPVVHRRSGLANLQARATARGGQLAFIRTEEGTTLHWTARLAT